MSGGTFSDWLAQQTGRGDDVGELARLAAGDADWPVRGALLYVYERRLLTRRAPGRTFQALYRAWGEWKALRLAARERYWRRG